MNAKQSVSVPVIVGALLVALAIACFLGFKAMSPPARQAPSAPEMYDAVGKMAIKVGGDYSKLSPADKNYLELMSHGHGQKLLENEYARVTASRGK